MHMPEGWDALAPRSTRDFTFFQFSPSSIIELSGSTLPPPPQQHILIRSLALHVSARGSAEREKRRKFSFQLMSNYTNV